MRAFFGLLFFFTAVVSAQSLPTPVIIYAVNQAKIASPMNGIISESPYREGQTFKQRDLLIKFKCDKALAEKRKAKATLEKKQAKYKGYIRLNNMNAISKLDFLEAKADFHEAQANLDLAGHKVEECYVYAPFEGQVIKTYVNAHEHIKLGEPLLEIVNFKDFEIKIIAPSTWQGRIKKGTPLTVTIKETRQSYPAKVTRVNHYIDPVSQTFAIFASFVGQTKDIKPGMSGQANFEGSP